MRVCRPHATVRGRGYANRRVIGTVVELPVKMSRVSLLAAVLGSLLFLGRGEFPFRNTSLPFDERVQVRSEPAIGYLIAVVAQAGGLMHRSF